MAKMSDAKKMGEKTQEQANGVGSAVNGRLSGELQNLATATATWALSALSNKLDTVTNRLTDYAENGSAGPGLLAAATGGTGPGGAVKGLMKKAVGSGLGKLNPFKGSSDENKGKGGQGKQPKVTNIIETIDVGVPLRLAYDQWTLFTEFPSFTKKVENVEQESDEKLVWRAKVFWSSREWESTILEQVPDQRIIWRSKGAKGHVDGAVTFHELAPELTRIVVVLEYFPQGFFEKTGNLWRAQGRRARLELKHFRRHVMTQSILHPEEIEGWRGEIHDGEVVSTGEEDSAEESPDDSPDDSREDRAEESEESPDTDDTAASDEAASDEEEAEPPEHEDEDDGTGARSQRRRTTGRSRSREDAEDTPKSRRPARSSTRRTGRARTGSRAATDKD